MKKTKKMLVVLASLALLSGVVSCDSTSESSVAPSLEPSLEPSVETSVSIPEAVAHNITTSGGKGAYVHVNKTSAKEGEPVTVTVVMTDSAYVLRGVKMGEKSLNAQVDEENPNVTTYGFQMPDENVEIVVDTFMPTKDHAILFKGSQDVVAIGLEDAADAGETVEFELRFTAGYTLKSIKVLKKAVATDNNTPEEDSDEVDLMSELTGRYYFEMPDCDVDIIVETEGAYFKLFFNSSEVIATTDYLRYGEVETKEWKMADFVSGFGMEDEGKITFASAGSSNTSAFMKAGSQAVFRAKRPKDYYTGTVIRGAHYYVDGVEAVLRSDIVDGTYTPTIQYAYEFLMPNHDAEITVAVEECNMVEVELNLPAQVEGTIYHKVDGENVTLNRGDKVAYGDVIYFTAKLKDDVDHQDWKLSSTYVSVLEYSSESSLTERENTTWNVEVDMETGKSSSYSQKVTLDTTEGAMKFTVPNDLWLVNDKMVVNFVVKSMSLYKGQPFVGKMWGNEMYNLKPYSATTAVDFAIASDGTITSAKQSSYLNGMITSIENMDSHYLDVKVKNRDKKLYMYGSSYTISYDGLSTDGNDTPNDFWFFVKSDLLTDDDNGIVYKYAQVKVRDTDSSNTGMVLQAFKKLSDGSAGDLLGTCFADKGENKYDIIPGVTITMIEGTYVDDENAKYTVAREGITYYTAQ